ncbi:hypothetical protein K402DRAFT_97793 [Aulographum hederae CBS 113979]|uniref:Uncharacterized protein n=1 Tax=Aulographum hederae CBS 113979 TaxID=1176131 RepID=A0A6G1GYZ9_9PEZI|nr:hypothetical protein K402DRAFT_97793 [Aulographum hederae CBS 113979]
MAFSSIALFHRIILHSSLSFLILYLPSYALPFRLFFPFCGMSLLHCVSISAMHCLDLLFHHLSLCRFRVKATGFAGREKTFLILLWTTGKLIRQSMTLFFFSTFLVSIISLPIFLLIFLFGCCAGLAGVFLAPFVILNHHFSYLWAVGLFLGEIFPGFGFPLYVEWMAGELFAIL